MAPTALSSAAPHVDIADLKSKVVNNHVELVEDHKPPVADNFMYDFKYNHALPTIDALGTDIPKEIDPQAEAESLVRTLEQVLGQGDAAGFAEMFLDYGRFVTQLACSQADVQGSGETSCPSLGTTEPSTSKRTSSELPLTYCPPTSARTSGS
jgi:hypothetical protein